MEAFTRLGYDGAGVRDIAKDAGVTAMMVNRYFGSKEQLFAEVVDTTFAPRTVVGSDPTALVHDVARSLVERTAPEAEGLSPFLLMLRSASNPRTAEIARQGIERHVERRLVGLLTGENTSERSALALSVIMRRVADAETDREHGTGGGGSRRVGRAPGRRFADPAGGAPGGQ